MGEVGKAAEKGYQVDLKEVLANHFVTLKGKGVEIYITWGDPEPDYHVLCREGRD